MSEGRSPSWDSFVRKTRYDRPDLVGARWWNEAMLDHMSSRRRELSATRRAALIQLGWIGGVGALIAAPFVCNSTSDDDDVEAVVDALQLQRQSGWNVGNADRSLVLSSASPTDVDGHDSWRQLLADGGLEATLQPIEPRLRPFYDPTLFQATAGTPGSSLRPQLAPMSTAMMQNAFGIGRVVADMFVAAGSPTDTALVIDLPGPNAVAMAAGLADRFAPTFVFGNWPHPRGVVPSHETIGAALYYLPAFERGNQTRGTPAPPAFVLDANRLLPYRDSAVEFDNRYAVSMPSASSLRELGIAHVLYVRPDDSSLLELDDLNQDFTALEAAGIPVRAMAMSDFWLDTTPPAHTVDAGTATAMAATTAATTARYHYHGGTYVHFWSSYGWYQPAPPRGRTAVPAAPVVSQPSHAASYRPVARQTIFSSRSLGGLSGVGKQKPSGFGRVSVRTSRSSGAVRSVGHHSGRSGSFGRGSSSSG